MLRMESKEIVLLPISSELAERLREGMVRLERVEEGMKALGAVVPEEYLTVKEFCRRAGIGRGTFERNKDKLVHRRVSPRKILIPISELHRWLGGGLNRPQPAQVELPESTRRHSRKRMGETY